MIGDVKFSKFIFGCGRTLASALAETFYKIIQQTVDRTYVLLFTGNNLSSPETFSN
jgi:hypothetical protein